MLFEITSSDTLTITLSYLKWSFTVAIEEYYQVSFGRAKKLSAIYKLQDWSRKLKRRPFIGELSFILRHNQEKITIKAKIFPLVSMKQSYAPPFASSIIGHIARPINDVERWFSPRFGPRRVEELFLCDQEVKNGLFITCYYDDRMIQHELIKKELSESRGIMGWISYEIGLGYTVNGFDMHYGFILENSPFFAHGLDKTTYQWEKLNQWIPFDKRNEAKEIYNETLLLYKNARFKEFVRPFYMKIAIEHEKYALSHKRYETFKLWKNTPEWISFKKTLNN
jgi:hypothetical protein